MRLDHIAYRTADRKKAAEFFMSAFGYKIQTEFELNFDDGSKAKCIALEPPEKTVENAPWKAFEVILPECNLEPNVYTKACHCIGYSDSKKVEMHLAPEIFVSDGTPDSIVGKWVANRDGIGGIHHLAYQVESVEETVKVWKDKGYAEFSSADVLKCPGLTQIFTKPSSLTGVIYEFINRGKHGFCEGNVKELMLSTKDNK